MSRAGRRGRQGGIEAWVAPWACGLRYGRSGGVRQGRGFFGRRISEGEIALPPPLRGGTGLLDVSTGSAAERRSTRGYSPAPLRGEEEEHGRGWRVKGSRRRSG